MHFVVALLGGAGLTKPRTQNKRSRQLVNGSIDAFCGAPQRLPLFAVERDALLRGQKLFSVVVVLPNTHL